MQNEKRISLIIPMYNETEILPDTLARVSAFMEGRYGEDYEVLYVDDGSSDGSADLVEKSEYPRTRVLRNAENHGKGFVVRQGMLAACGRVRVFTDCDLAYGTEMIGTAADFLENNPEFGAVIGSRDKHPEGYAGYTFMRKLASRTFRSVLRILGGLKLSDSQSGIKGFTAAAAEKIFSRAETNGFAFDFEAILLADRLGISFGEIPAKVVGNRPGHVRLLRDSTRMLREIFRIKKRVKNLKNDN